MAGMTEPHGTASFRESVPRISFLVPNIGGPSLGFATAYAKALAGRYPVQVAGPELWKGGVMPMYRGRFDYTVVPTPRLYRYPDYLWQVERLHRAVTGDVIFAVKATPQTVGVALREKRRRGCKVVVCLDEWDGALMARRSPSERRAFWLRHWMHPLEENYYPLVERQLPQADLVLSTSTWLQRKFGGKVVRMGVDTELFKPLAAPDKASMRKTMGLAETDRVIVFGGVVRPHKGVEQILDAMQQAGEGAFRLLVVGPVTDTLESLMKGPMGNAIVAVGSKSAQEMPLCLGAGDLTVLPMTDDLLSQSQVPCKIFESMAMGLPVAVGAVSDLPEIVTGAGEVFPVGDIAALAGILKRWSRDPEQMAQYGRTARQRCLELFSFEVMKEQLAGAMDQLLKSP